MDVSSMDVGFLKLVEEVNKLETKSSVPESLFNATVDKIKAYLLCEQTHGDDRPPEEKDFEDHLVKTLTGLTCLLSFLKGLQRFSNQELHKNFMVWSLLLCGEHSSTELWTTSNSVKISSECLDTLLFIHKCNSVSSLLLSGISSQSYFSLALSELRPKVLKDTWRRYPAAVHTYQWMLHQIKSPHLSDYLNRVFPTALIILDDYVISRRLTGLVCITHIVKNVPRTDLCSQGMDDVLYHALSPLLLQREPELVTPIYTCMTTLLESVEKGYTKSVKEGQWSRLESTLLTLLHNMECEDRLVLRLAYVQSLEPILKAMGPAVIQLGKKLLAVFDDYLHKQTPDARHYAILAFQTYIYNTEVRLPTNGEKVLFLLLRTLYDLTEEMNLCELCSDITFTETAGITDSKKICGTHRTDDLEIIIKSLRFVEKCTPKQLECMREDIREKVNFNPLLTNILGKLF